MRREPRAPTPACLRGGETTCGRCGKDLTDSVGSDVEQVGVGLVDREDREQAARAVSGRAARDDGEQGTAHDPRRGQRGSTTAADGAPLRHRTTSTPTAPVRVDKLSISSVVGWADDTGRHEQASASATGESRQDESGAPRSSR